MIGIKHDGNVHITAVPCIYLKAPTNQLSTQAQIYSCKAYFTSLGGHSPEKVVWVCPAVNTPFSSLFRPSLDPQLQCDSVQ